MRTLSIGRRNPDCCVYAKFVKFEYSRVNQVHRVHQGWNIQVCKSTLVPDFGSVKG
jgi:hypothetical protein